VDKVDYGDVTTIFSPAVDRSCALYWSVHCRSKCLRRDVKYLPLHRVGSHRVVDRIHHFLTISQV
jgi:hypothetical protein